MSDSNRVLVPCPFCAANDYNIITLATGRKAVQCDQCYAEGPEGKDEETAIKEWNVRLSIST